MLGGTGQGRKTTLLVVLGERALHEGDTVSAVDVHTGELTDQLVRWAAAHGQTPLVADLSQFTATRR